MFGGFTHSYKKAKLLFTRSVGRVVGPFSLHNPIEAKDFKLAHFLFNDNLMQR